MFYPNYHSTLFSSLPNPAATSNQPQPPNHHTAPPIHRCRRQNQCQVTFSPPHNPNFGALVNAGNRTIDSKEEREDLEKWEWRGPICLGGKREGSGDRL